MSQEPQNKRVIEETDEDTNLFVTDPDDYQQTKRRQTIYKTKQQVLQIRKKRHKLIPELSTKYRDKGHKVYNHKLSQAVAQYGLELLPLINEALQTDTLERSDLKINPIRRDQEDVDIRKFVRMDGRFPSNDGWDVPHEQGSLTVYERLITIQRKLGLGLDLEEQKGPAEI